MMKGAGTGFLLLLLAVTAFAQDEQIRSYPTELKSIELLSPWRFVDGKTTHNRDIGGRYCLNLMTLTHGCGRGHTIDYGSRIGINWDIFQVSSVGSQTRMIDLGKHEWTDTLNVPPIQPWAKLKPGEKRHISVNASGRDGEDGEPGKNADGSTPFVTRSVKREGYADKPVAKQVNSTIVSESGETIPDRYSPLLEAKLGHIYAVRIFDDENDFYLLIRVEGIERGEKIALSIKRIAGPTVKPIY